MALEELAGVEGMVVSIETTRMVPEVIMEVAFVTIMIDQQATILTTSTQPVKTTTLHLKLRPSHDS